MGWQEMKRIMHLIEKEMYKSKSNSAGSYMRKAIDDLQQAQEEEDAYKRIGE